MADEMSSEDKENVSDVISSVIMGGKSYGSRAVIMCRTPLLSLNSQENILKSIKADHQYGLWSETPVSRSPKQDFQMKNGGLTTVTDIAGVGIESEAKPLTENIQQSTPSSEISGHYKHDLEQSGSEQEENGFCCDVPEKHLISTSSFLKEDTLTEDAMLNNVAHNFVLNVIINAACKLLMEQKSSAKIMNQAAASTFTSTFYHELRKTASDSQFDYSEGMCQEGNSSKDVTVSSHKSVISMTWQTNQNVANVRGQTKLRKPRINQNKTLGHKTTKAGDCRSQSKCSLPVYSQFPKSSSVLSKKANIADKGIQTMDIQTPKVEAVSVSTSPIVILEPKASKPKNIEEEKSQLQTKYLQSQQLGKDLKSQSQKIRSKNAKKPVVKEIQNNHELNDCRKKIESLESKISQQKKTIVELQEANRTYKSEILSRDKELKKTVEQKQKIDAKLADERVKFEKIIQSLEQKAKTAETQVKLLSSKVADLEKTNHHLSERLKKTEEEMKALEGKYRNESSERENRLTTLLTECERLKQEMDDLSKTLESREQEISEITKENKRLTDLVSYQQMAMENMRKKCAQMDKIRNEMIEVEEQMKKMEKSAAETQEFLEHERTALKDELMEKEQVVNELNFTVLQLTEENKALKETVANLEQQYSELAADLDETKVQAHFLLLQQNTELTDSITAASKLLAHLNDFHHELTECLCKEKHHESKLNNKSVPQETVRESIIGTVMSSIRKQFPDRQLESTTKSCGERKEDDDSNDSLNLVDEQLELSGIKPLPGADNSITVSDEASPNGHSDLDEPRTNDPERFIDNRIEPLNKQVEDINLVAQAALNLFRDLYKLLKDRELKLEKEKQTVEDHLAMEQESAAQEKRSLKALVSSLRRELEEKCLREKQLRDELLHACKQIEQKDEDLNNAQRLIMERTERMEVLTNQLRNIKKDEKELIKMNTLLKEREVELSLIKQMLSTELEKIAQKYGAVASHPIKEMIYLRKENVLLNDANLQLQNEKEAIYEKLSKRMDAYKTNWKVADEEIGRLDRFIERIRQALFTEIESLKSNEKLRPILCELELLSPEIDSKSA